jgi:sortase A
VGYPGRVGRVLLALAAVVALFVAYQLWGTGIAQSHQQDALRHQFDEALRAHQDSEHGTVHPPADPSSPATSGERPPAVGEPVGTLVIPEIGVDQVVVQGTGTAQLAAGPGHYPGTALPGQAGNAAIAGHRTTHGRPFYNLQNLAPGDPLTVTTVQGTFRYSVVRSEVVAPTDIAVLDPSPVPELTLTTCTPRFSAAQRLVVVARLVTPSMATPVSTAVPVGPASANQVGPDPVRDATDWFWLVLWGLACAAVVALARVAWRRLGSRRAWLAVVVVAPAAVVTLFFFFGAVNTMLPPSL